jgi:hypothetical protein
MTTNRLEASCVELLSEFFGWQAIGSCQLDVLDVESAYLVQGGGYVFLELIAKAIELETDWSFETWTGTGRALTVIG